MTGPVFRFAEFRLYPATRRLTRNGAPVAVSGRYFDALVLLVGEEGRVVSKDRFMAEVWRGVPVTDEALTQCVRTLRRALGDDAARPRFIETVTGHGYRFVAPVEPGQTPITRPIDWGRALKLGGAGGLGGAAAGAAGGVAFGLAVAGDGLGAASVLLVLICLTALVGLLGGTGAGFGLAIVEERRGTPGPWSLAGGALGGLVVGAMVKLVGLDVFALLFGRSPQGITGAGEGALLGAALGLGAWIGGRRLRRSVVVTALTTAAAGALVPILGGRLMAGSLDLLARTFPDSRLSLAGLGAPFGEAGLGPASAAVVSGLEGLLFGAFVAAALGLARRR